MKVKLKSQAGFSLVELMVVVAIIGILAAIAIPNFQRFTAKSKQAEAKSNLAALYSAEKAFAAEWQTFHSSFVVVGYAPAGFMRYQHGFGTATAVGQPGNYSGPSWADANISTVALCAQGGSTMTNGCNVVVLPQAPGTTLTGSVAPTTSVFTAAAVAYIGNATVEDVWTIDQNKNEQNTTSGLP